jgi:cytochrome P450
MTDKELFSELSNFMIAGTDTTAGLVNMMMHMLAENPEVQARLRSSIDEVIKSDSDITHDNLKRLQYIDWIQN